MVKWMGIVLLSSGLGLAGPARPLPARGTVTGTLSLLERDGATAKDLADAVVYLTRAEGAAEKLATAPRIAMQSREFRPHVRVVTVGSAVEFPNEDPFRHNVFSNAGPSGFDLGLYGRGESRRATFGRPGVYPIFCNIHAKMTAFVLAVSTPYYAQPSADGRFSLDGVPAGTYTLHVWHERGGEHTRPVEVGADGLAGITVQLDARNYRFVQHKNKLGKDYPASAGERY